MLFDTVICDNFALVTQPYNIVVLNFLSFDETFLSFTHRDADFITH